MKKNILGFVCLSILAAAATGRVSAQDSGLPTLIVAPFGGDITHIQYWQPALGEGLAEMLITEMGKINKFTVLETTQLGALKDEIKMGEDGWVEQTEKVEKGGFAAADFMFTAKVTRFGHKESKIGLGGFVPGNLGNLGVKQSRSDVRIDWRLVDASSRKIIKTGSATAEEKGTGFDVGVNVGGSGGRIGFDNKEFMDSALGKATVKALAQITERNERPDRAGVQPQETKAGAGGQANDDGHRERGCAQAHAGQGPGRGRQGHRHHLPRRQARLQGGRQTEPLRNRGHQRRQRRGGVHGRKADR